MSDLARVESCRQEILLESILDAPLHQQAIARVGFSICSWKFPDRSAALHARDQGAVRLLFVHS